MKKILAILLSSLVLISLAACSGNNSDVPKSQTAAGSQSISSSVNSTANDNESGIKAEDLVGQWQLHTYIYYTFNADGTGTQQNDKYEDNNADITWKLDGDILSITATYLDGRGVYQYKNRVEISKVSGNLTLHEIKDDGTEGTYWVYTPYVSDVDETSAE